MDSITRTGKPPLPAGITRPFAFPSDVDYSISSPAPSKKSYKTAPSEDVQSTPHKSPQLGDFSSLKRTLGSPGCLTDQPQNPFSDSEERESVRNPASDAQCTTKANPITSSIRTKATKLPYNLLRVPKLGNFSSLNLSQEAPRSAITPDQSTLGDFSKIFEDFRKLSRPSDAFPSTTSVKLFAVARQSLDARSHGNDKASSSLTGVESSKVSKQGCAPKDLANPVNTHNQSENTRHRVYTNRSARIDTDSDLRTSDSSSGLSSDETDITTPPRSPQPVINYGRSFSEPQAPANKAPTAYHDVTFSYTDNNGIRHAITRADLLATQQAKRHDYRGLDELEKLRMVQHCLDQEIADKYPEIAKGGVYVFADVSNTFISLVGVIKDMLGIDMKTRISPQPDVDWAAFVDVVLKRNRNIKSLRAGCSVDPRNVRREEPKFIKGLKASGFVVDISNRVEQQDGSYPEELVDEGIQARIGDTLDKAGVQPGTIVIVTGDGKPAKHSAGFVSYAKKALELGWNVEILAWSKGCSNEWRKPDWKTYGCRYRLTQLDAYLGEILAPSQ